MRKLLGTVVFVIGVVALGWWGMSHQARIIEQKVTEGAEAAIASSMHPVSVTVSGRDITLTGTADTRAELDGMVAALNMVPGRRVVNAAGVEVLPLVAPYESALAKGTDGALVATGFGPSAAAIAPLGVDGLALGHGAPEGWADTMKAGLAALAPLQEGSFTLTDDRLTLTGVAATPAEEQAARDALNLAAATDPAVVIEVLDPGIIDFSVAYDAVSGFAVGGTVLPANLNDDTLNAVLGTEGLGADLGSTAVDLPGAGDKLAALAASLTEIESFDAKGSNDGLAVSVVAMLGVDPDALAARLAELAGGAAGLTVTAAPAPEDGATRTLLSGAVERAFGGLWFAVPDFEPTQAACTEASMAKVAATPIQFVTGSAELDPTSLGVLNDLAGVVLHCTEDGGLSVEIGGHTDDVGDDAANMELSTARATAVSEALARRGVPVSQMLAKGYGETIPIAPNDTDEGRAQNRRTTFDWQ